MKALRAFFLFSVVLSFLVVQSVFAKAPSEEQKVRIQEAYGKLPLYFIENHGQVDERVRLYEKGLGQSLYFTDDGIHLLLTRKEAQKVKTDERRGIKGERGSGDKVTAEALTIKPIGMSAKAEIIAEERLSGRVNYFIGNDPKKWKKDIPTYGKVRYREVYEGIDLVFYGNQRQLEYDVVVKPGKDYKPVAFRIEGAREVKKTEDGSLKIVLNSGSSIIQKKPYVYQEIGGSKKEIKGEFELKEDELGYLYSFNVKDYDRDHALIIDPVVLSYSTYLGGSIGDWGEGIAVDASGNAYVTGWTESTNFPTQNAYQGSKAGSSDAFVTKLSPNGNSLIYSTYLGGGSNDWSYGIAVDASGNAYVTGATESTDFPTQNAYQGSFGGYYDAFVTKLSPNGNSLIYSTYLGGSSDDWSYGIAVDASGNAYVTGYTDSTDFPTLNAYDNTCGTDGNCNYDGIYHYSDVFVTKLTNLSGEIHFEFSPISSPQSVGVPFNITITAKDAYGNVMTGWSGEVVLASTIGMINPTRVYLTNGSVTLSVTLDSAGNNVKIQATGGGKSGQSNLFNVTGGIVQLASIGGVVKDSLGNRISGATVWLNNGINPISTTTDSNGKYQFRNLPPGQYYIWASYNGMESRGFNINLSGSITKDLVLLGSLCNPTALTPILLVPGITGSSTEDKMYPSLPANAPSWNDPIWDKYGVFVYHGLYDPFGIVGWKDLINIIISVDPIHYELGCNIFTVPYDWRMSIEDAARNYLKPWIDEAKTKAGTDKVNIISLSMGGLVTRAYIQSNDYDYDIDKFAMVGTPNHGAANAYYIWEGGDPKLADDVNEEGLYELVNYYSNTFVNIYQAMNGINWGNYMLACVSCNLNPIPPSLSNYEIRDFVHQHVPSLRELLPTYWFLRSGSILKGIMDPESVNNKLIELNKNPDMKGVTAKIFPGTGEKTISIIKVGIPNELYKDGVPKKNIPFISENPEKSTDGDGTVMLSSALLNSIPSYNPPKIGPHASLVKIYKDDLVEFMTGIYPSSIKVKAKAISTASTVLNGLTISTHGRVKPYLIDPLGRKSGINPDTDLREDEIPDSVIAMDVNSGSISLENPIDGIYTLYLKDSYSEDYQLSIFYVDGVETLAYKYWGFNHANTTSFTFTLNSLATDKLTINHTPQLPTNLQADAVDLGGLKTRLTWDLSSDPNVDHYNIYSKYDDEPYLTQIGTSTTNLYDTDHPWDTSSSVKTRVYAVSAVKADGTESFLSNMAENNDRDHDNLKDEEEVSLGTNPDNPDSDGDGLKDGEEYILGTNPLQTDTDGDGYSDYAEVQIGSDPLNAQSYPVTLTVTKSGPGTGTVTSNDGGINCGSDCSEVYNSGTTVTLTATPDAGSIFVGWSGDADCSDGVVTMDADKTCVATFITEIQSLITWYYNQILGRDPDAGGLNYWTSEIERAISLGICVNEGFIVLGKNFFNSQEYLSYNTTDTEYVTDLYWTFLHREPDLEGLSYWVGQLGMGLPRNIVLDQFIFSQEFQDYMGGIFGYCSVRPEYVIVTDLYRGFLWRLPDNSGFNYWLGLVQDAQCNAAPQGIRNVIHQMALDFTHSQEYANRGVNNSGFVVDEYDAILRRGGDYAGYQYWVNLLNNGSLTRDEELNFFVNSTEFQTRVQQVIDAGCAY